ncbi:MAG TPA: nucleotidyltransferase domain-containing protein [Epsilonproteobacteria bacterium]|nr:nucleotidyltransferase domain-containing protein [Campylobacterota bacterium]
MKITQEKILTYLKELKPELESQGIEELALFGSFSTETQNVYSDIDIAIKKKKNFLEEHTAYDYLDIVSKIKYKTAKALHLPSDVFDLDSQSTFKNKIENELIYV